MRFAALHLRAAPDPGGQGPTALPDHQAPQQPAPFAPLVGELYYAAKEQLILDEQARTLPPKKCLLLFLVHSLWYVRSLRPVLVLRAPCKVPLELLLLLLVPRLSTGLSNGPLGRLQVLLRTLHFDLIAEQPLRYLLNFCCLLRCSHAVSKLAVCLACPLV